MAQDVSQQSPRDEAARPEDWPRPIAGTRLENLYQYGEGFFGGSEPESEEDFAELAALGVKVLLSVDGARPRVAEAARHGLRYVHVPIGYDGLPEEARRKLARATRGQAGPFYVHCHHGLHRGPAALACLQVANGTIPPEQGVDWLKRVGTSPDYQGLYRDVAATRFIPDEDLARVPPPPPVAPVSDLAEAMVRLDRTWDHLKLAQSNRWRPPARHPDLSPRHEALLLHEGLVELGRRGNEASNAGMTKVRDPEFDRLLEESIQRSKALLEGLRQGIEAGRLDRRFSALRQTCSDCHHRLRD